MSSMDWRQALLRWRIQFRRGTTDAWESANPVLLLGEPGWDIDLLRMKIGDGETPWNDLLWASLDPTQLQEILDLLEDLPDLDDERMSTVIADVGSDFFGLLSDYVESVTVDYIPLTQRGANNGVATLDSGGKLPTSQLPTSVMDFKGAWNASTNSPTLVDGTGDAGDQYRVSVAGTRNLGSGSIVFDIGDAVIYSGTVWQKYDNTESVSSVAGKTGVVVLARADVSLNKAGMDAAMDEVLVDPTTAFATDLSASIEGVVDPAITAEVARADGTYATPAAVPPIVDTYLTSDRYAPHGMVEFRWILPTSLYLAEPYRHTLCAALGDSNGTSTPVLIVDASHESGNVQTYQIATTPADDHNAPSVITGPGNPIVVQWSHHGLIDVTYPGGHPFLYYKVGLPDRPDTLVDAPVQAVNMGASASYGQAWNVAALTDDEKVTNVRLYRRDLTTWYLLTEEIDRKTLEVTTDAPGVPLVDGNGLQCYVTSARGSRDGQVLRLAWGTSPASEPDWVKYFEVDLVTGAITSPFDDTLAANLDGTDLPLTTVTGPQFLPNLTGAKAAYERRLLGPRPWPGDVGMLTAEGDPGSRAATAHYWLHSWDGEFTAETTGTPAAATGLLAPLGSPSYAHTTDVPLAAGAAGIKITHKFTLPATKPGSSYAYLDVCGQQDADSDGWYMWIGANTNELKVRFSVNRVGGNSLLTSTAVLAGGATWGSTVWVRVTYTPTAVGGYRCVMESSLDGTTWTNIGNIAGNSGAILVAGSAYTWVGARAMGRAPGLVVKYSKIELNTGSGFTTRSELDFTSDSAGALNWHGYDTAHTDAQANDWDLVGAASIGRTAYGPTIPPEAIPVSHDLGAVGAAPDYASYYPGAAFNGESVILARTAGANQQLVASYVDASDTVQETVLRTQPTTEGKFFRPMPPDNGGPLWCWLVNVTDYGSNEFYDWESSLVAVRRL